MNEKTIFTALDLHFGSVAHRIEVATGKHGSIYRLLTEVSDLIEKFTGKPHNCNYANDAQSCVAARYLLSHGADEGEFK
jgi:hypothetical protein